HRLHSFCGEVTGILDLLLADAPEPWVLGWIIDIRRKGVKDAARSISVEEVGIFRRFGIVRIFRLVLGVEVIKIAEELVEAVQGGKKFVAITDVVLAELPGGVALRLEQLSDRRVLV